DQTAKISTFRRVVFIINLYEESYRRGASEESPTAPDGGQECGHVSLYRCPQRPVIRFEDHPLRAFVDGFFDEQQEPPNIDVQDRSVCRKRSRTPDHDTGRGERPDDVDPDRIEQFLLSFGNKPFDGDGGVQIAFIDSGRSLV